MFPKKYSRSSGWQACQFNKVAPRSACLAVATIWADTTSDTSRCSNTLGSGVLGSERAAILRAKMLCLKFVMQ